MAGMIAAVSDFFPAYAVFMNLVTTRTSKDILRTVDTWDSLDMRDLTHAQGFARATTPLEMTC